MHNLGGQISGLPQLFDVLFRDGGGHPSALKARSGHGRKFGALRLILGCWNSGWGKGGIERDKKRAGFGPLIKRANIKRPPRGRSELA